jgi:hypothetical protein
LHAAVGCAEQPRRPRRAAAQEGQRQVGGRPGQSRCQLPVAQIGVMRLVDGHAQREREQTERGGRHGRHLSRL